ncbi:MAG: tetratricopeptide repeat protein [Planctomycetaceae bacterium]
MWFDRSGDSRVCRLWSLAGIRTFILGCVFVVGPASVDRSFGDGAAEYNEKAMALYADAANFQTNGATELAIEGWKKFLEKYPNEPFASKAAHYLGVCYMQQSPPDYPAACDAFAKAVRDQKSELREESLVNLGWCQYAAAGEGEKPDAKRLQAALETFRTLLKEKPASKFADRALFYGGEAAYALGDAKTATAFYDRLIAMEAAKDSALRCDAFYARGVALEDLKKLDEAIQSYRQLLDGCQDERLISDARIRVGDVYILQKKFAEALKEFATVASGQGPDVPYALVRQAFSHVQAGQPKEAAAIYERLLTEFPDSEYTAAATLASAQSVYRAGDMDEAARRFQRVLSQKDAAAATEAAHWLATIAIRKGSPQEAMQIAQKQLDAGAAGEFASVLKLDLADAKMLIPDQVAEAQKLYLSIYRAAPEDAQAPRALYNAAFASMQLGQLQESGTLANEFLSRFKESPLTPDVHYISAESKLMSGEPASAAQQYQSLLSDPASKENVQRPLWVLRAGMANHLAGKHDDAIKLLSEQLGGSAAAPQRAEAKYIIGASHLAAGRAKEAVGALQESIKTDDKWLKAAEAALLLGQAWLAAGDQGEASKAWQSIIQNKPKSPHADQARYRLAQLAAQSGDHELAASEYAKVIASGADPSLTAFSLYGQGWNLLQAGKPADAVEPLNRIVQEFPAHSIADDARLALGISYRTIGKTDQSVEQLQSVLEQVPQGINRGHALYELALIDQQLARPAEAARRLEQLVTSVPNYPSMDKVLYEWSWSLKESDQAEKAEATFKQLIDKYPTNPLAAEAHYFIGQRRYDEEKWAEAASSFEQAVKTAEDNTLLEKSLYRLGWARFKALDFKGSADAFAQQAEKFPDGKLIADALLMIGENQFKQEQYEAALASYTIARDRILAKDESAKTIAEGAERQVRELVFLHGGQSAAQLKQWEPAIQWYDQLRSRFPETGYLAQSLYETGFAYQQLGDDDQALTFFSTVANDYRNEVAARSRFMIGEIYFGKRDLAKAIPEFQRVMYGYGAEQAPEPIKNWQAKSGFEAGRCAELLIQNTNDPARREKATAIAKEFFQYVVDKHSQHELASKSQERLDVLNRIAVKPDSGAARSDANNSGTNRTQAAN